MKFSMQKRIATLAFAIILIFSAKLYAASLTGASNVNVGDTFTLTYNFGQSVGAYDNISVSYDSNVFEYVSGDPLNESVWYDSSAEQYGISTKSYTFRAKNSGSARVAVVANGVVSADSSMTRTETVTAEKLVNVQAVVAPQEKPTTTQNTQGNVNPTSSTASGNNYLSYLQISEEGLSPFFARNVVDYAITVGENVSSIEVLALPDDPNARVEISGNTNIVEGDNYINIKVTAENGYYRNYTITVTKVKDTTKANAFLENLIIEGYEFTKPFQAESLSYDLGEIPFGIESFNIAAIAKDPNAKVEIVGADKLVESGEGLITVKVTAQDGTTTREYKVKYTVKAAGAEELQEKQMQDYLKDIQGAQGKKAVFVSYLKYIWAAIKKNYLLVLMYALLLVNFIVIIVLSRKLKKAKDYTYESQNEDKTILKVEAQDKEETSQIEESVRQHVKIEPPKVELLKEDDQVSQETTTVDLPKLGRAGSRAEDIVEESEVKPEIKAANPGKIQLVDLDKNEGPKDELTFNIFDNLNEEDIKRLLDDQIDKE